MRARRPLTKRKIEPYARLTTLRVTVPCHCGGRRDVVVVMLFDCAVRRTNPDQNNRKQVVQPWALYTYIYRVGLVVNRPWANRSKRKGGFDPATLRTAVGTFGRAPYVYSVLPSFFYARQATD